MAAKKRKKKKNEKELRYIIREIEKLRTDFYNNYYMYYLYVCATGYERNTPDSMAGVCSDVDSTDHEITNESGDELVEFTQPGHKARRSDQETERAADQTSGSDEAGSNSSDLPNTERSCVFTVRITGELAGGESTREKSCDLPDTQNTNKTGGDKLCSQTSS
jgi:hypothetical protein